MAFPPGLLLHETSFMKFNETWRSDVKYFPPPSEASQCSESLMAPQQSACRETNFRCATALPGEETDGSQKCGRRTVTRAPWK